jgi:CDP-glucose 4,6-dehydratase
LNLLEACRRSECVKAIVNVTSDKCYENREWVWGYRETDRIGGHDPYSASKGCVELLANSFQKSFFPLHGYRKSHQTLTATARAGNVIGGGDWGEDRLVPDVMRAAGKGEKVFVRNPGAIRPWQHVLDPLAGYLLIGQRLLEGNPEFSGPWNLGPDESGQRNVGGVVEELRQHWPAIQSESTSDENGPHEAGLLKLDCAKARTILGWKPVWDGPRMFEQTARWYREFYESHRVVSREQLDEFTADARREKSIWATSEDPE